MLRRIAKSALHRTEFDLVRVPHPWLWVTPTGTPQRVALDTSVTCKGPELIAEAVKNVLRPSYHVVVGTRAVRSSGRIAHGPGGAP